MHELKVKWTSPALADLRAIKRWIARTDPAAGVRLAGQISERTTALGRHPQLGRAVPELPGLGFRELSVTPYRIIYRDNLEAGLVLIVRIWHARRSMSRLADRGGTCDA